FSRGDGARDRRAPLSQQADGRDPPGEHLRQARCPVQDRARPPSVGVRDLTKSRRTTDVSLGRQPYVHRSRDRKEIGTMNETKMMEFVDRAVGDVGAVLGGAMVVIGDKLGLYRSMAGAGSLTAAELAEITGTTERYVREWLSAQAARGYVSYDGDGQFSLPDEH